MPSPSSTDKLATEIRVIAPSYGWEPGYEERDARAKERLQGIGYEVTLSERIKSQYHLGTASAADRVADFHDALRDKNVKVIMAYSGGWSANEMLPLIDWGLVKANPKPLVGYSDVTVLLDAIYAKTGVIGYLGPNFGTFGLETSWQYTLENFQKVMQEKAPIDIKPSLSWADEDGQKQNSQSWYVLQEGQAEAILIGGNFNTFHLLQGTEFQPHLNVPFILAAEDDDESGALTPRYFSRRLESILQLPGARQNIKGIIIGRFLSASQFSEDDLVSIIESKHLGNIPLVANMDFGHTLPLLTLPIGGKLRISATSEDIKLALC